MFRLYDRRILCGLGSLQGDILGTQQDLVKLVQGLVDIEHIVVVILDKVHNDQIELAAGGQRVSGTADEVPGLIHVQFQGDGKGNGCGLGGLVVGIVADLGEVLPGPSG